MSALTFTSHGSSSTSSARGSSPCFKALSRNGDRRLEDSRRGAAARQPRGVRATRRLPRHGSAVGSRAVHRTSLGPCWAIRSSPDRLHRSRRKSSSSQSMPPEGRSGGGFFGLRRRQRLHPPRSPLVLAQRRPSVKQRTDWRMNAPKRAHCHKGQVLPGAVSITRTIGSVGTNTAMHPDHARLRSEILTLAAAQPRTS